MRPIITSSPRATPATAVAANVVALVIGTASEIGASRSRAKKATEADRLTRNGTEYCQNRRRSRQFFTEPTSFRRRVPPSAEDAAEDPWDWDQRIVPRRIRALVVPQISPTAIIL
ncbi:hypothetical protein MLD38_014339 [Melastoma candidum]|uniref:Uncharacterized protein n=1 Tax=Melastoma candidum TaxID=119954 RepID=A0ACB9RGN0_9MYRT|nr:hypothetical protein MLD38_014339 [Melastoma candidum]